MDITPRSSRAGLLKRALLRFALACGLFWIACASPPFLVSMGWRIVTGELSIPRSVSRAPGPWGDGYLVIEDGADNESILFDTWGRELCRPGGGHDGEGDGRCPGALSQRWLSIRLWSLEWGR